MIWRQKVRPKTHIPIICLAIGLVALSCGWVAGAESPGVVRIENQSLVVEFNAQDLTFRATSRDGLRFIERGTLQQPGATASRVSVAHPVWGQGEAIRIEQRAGAYDQLALFPGLPFIVFESALANSSDVNETVGSIRPVSMTLDLARDVSGLRALGTAGLTGVTISSARQEDWKVRVQIDSQTSQDVHWTVRFPSLR
jgi:hypothetical protein